MYSSFGKFLQTIPLFKDRFSRPFLKALSLEIEEVHFTQGETIFRDRDSDLNDFDQFYFVNEGSVLIYPHLGPKRPQNVYLQKLRAGQYFGEWSFLTGQPRKASAMAYSYTSLYMISRQKFLKTLSDFPEDYEAYCVIRDRLTLDTDIQALQQQCWTCGRGNHFSTNCPWSHYVPQTLNVVNLDEGIRSERVEFERRPAQRWHTIRNQPKLVRTARRNPRKTGRLATILQTKQKSELTKSQKSNNTDDPVL